ncbi:MAG: GTPase domain-containing protein [Bdellovibrionaceae bacterium]|nr:GTPase domain-containing protein [Pseudobdellovibrionaceae bacterium]
MALINQETKELHCKIVYYGPALGGKTTNIRQVFKSTHDDQEKSDLIEFDMGTPERTRFFDFLPLNVGEIRGLKVRFHLYTVPGQVIYDASRRLILKNLDGIIFVADSQIDRMDENILSLQNLEKNLDLAGYNIRKIPLVVQYNKRDLPNSASIAELRAALNKYNSPDFEAEAEKGVGVMQSLNTLAKTIVATLKSGNV